ncbi:MAG: bifunctional adenosylcobinamide kinase/adenosylcobinamide-phosphate guanylyltransferase [Lachnospiraceae bacterium]|nr:bifunctional adenosylcobinamide kinase/adenosylcobinamide-phosphate guanylyltransferase [Lachnospiraceae bacterium]
MLLIVGGEGSGKRSFAKTLGYLEEEMADGILDHRPVLFHLEQMVFRDPECIDSLLPRLAEKELILCNEVGSGIIPVDHRERLCREATGRLCVLLAGQANCVVRMVSGLPMVIKGSLPCRS